MSYEIDFGDDESYFLGTTQDWSDFLAWVESLDKATYPNLRGFATDGASANLEIVREQIEHALKTQPPKAKGVESTAQQLCDWFDGRDDKEVAAITA